MRSVIIRYIPFSNGATQRRETGHENQDSGNWHLRGIYTCRKNVFRGWVANDFDLDSGDFRPNGIKYLSLHSHQEATENVWG